MKIAVVGCGAVGSFYGARLCRAGETVHFLLRSDYEVVLRQGVQIRSVDGDFHVRPHCARQPEAIGCCDLVLIALKTTANDQFARLLPPLVGPDTRVVTLQNGLGNEARLAERLGPQNILGGLCFVCLNRLSPGLILHSAHGRIVLGEYQRPPLPRTHQLAGLLQRAGVPCKITPHLEQAHWEKLIWNVPFNGLGVAGAIGYELFLTGAIPPGTAPGRTLPTNALLDDPRWETLVRELMREVILTANACGFCLAEIEAEKNIERTRCMGAYRASTLLDFERGLPLELESLFQEPLRRARQAGIPTPRLAMLTEVLTQLNPASP